MCLAVPLKIVEINGKTALGEVDSIRRSVRLDLVPKAKLGDYVMVHAGFAIELLSPERALKNLSAIMEAADAASK